MADQDPNKILQETAETISALKDAFNSLGAVIKTQLNSNLIDADNFTKQYARSVKSDATRALNELGKSSERIIENQYKLNKGQLTSKDISKQIQEVELKNLKIQSAIQRASDNGLLGKRQAKKLQDQITSAYQESVFELERQNEAAEGVENKIGAASRILKGIGNIPILGGILNTEKGLEAMRAKAAEVGSSGFGAMKAGMGGLVDKTKIAQATLTYLITAGFKADVQITKLAKSLTQTKNEAEITRENLAGMARASGDNFITTEKLVESTIKLGQQLGIAQTFSADLTKEFTTLTGKIGLSEEAAGGLAKLTVASGKNARIVTNEALGTAQALQSQAGLQLDNRQILEETGKVSGQLLANFKGNPVAIAAAVTQTKLLGTTLEQTKKQSSSLLDFRSSIEDQLNAQLITGEQLNLENARALALAGDQAGVAKELSNQGMNFSKFSRLNVLAQNDYAKALGLSSDELSDQLLKQQYYGKSVKEVAALEGEQVAQRLEAQSAQDKFNQAVEKLQDIFVSLIDGPIGQFLNLLGDILGIIGKIGQLIAKVIPAPLLKVLMGAGAGFLAGGPIGALVGGGLAAGSEIYNASTANDMMSDYGDRTLITPQGSYALNNNDTVIAGTNLFRGNDVYSGPKGAINLSGTEIDYDKLASSMSKVQMVTYARPSEFATPIGGKIIRDQRVSM
jgi:hypothetical protein